MSAATEGWPRCAGDTSLALGSRMRRMRGIGVPTHWLRAKPRHDVGDPIQACESALYEGGSAEGGRASHSLKLRARHSTEILVGPEALTSASKPMELPLPHMPSAERKATESDAARDAAKCVSRANNKVAVRFALSSRESVACMRLCRLATGRVRCGALERPSARRRHANT